MTEEIKDNKSAEEPRPEAGTEEEPQVYSVNKGLTGWKFGRREFLAATATAAAAVTAAAMVATDKSGAAAPDTAVAGEALMLDVALPVMMAVQPAQSFAQTWRFTNKSQAAWCKGATLHLANADGYIRGDQLQAPASVAVPDIAPGETVNVQIDLKAPADLSTYQGHWHLQVQDDPTPVASGPFVVVAACIAESPHNYANNANQTWILDNPDTSAQSTRVHFSRLETEGCCDFVYLKDNAGQVHQQISGTYASGLWSDPVPGSVVRVQLTSDSSVTAWGFCIDLIETLQTYPLFLALVARAPTLTPTPTMTPTPKPTATPCRCYGVCTCNPHCTCDRIHYWYPN
ncbi:MAG TPA: NBR1-Ig-like domain-containing protein [Anaerolineae bacterium]|nr:NBR1-Ig-like domain-containing protein [Anaerolineae bacterium]